MKSRHANEYDDENYNFDDDSSNRFDDFSDDQDAADSKDMNFYVEEGDDAGSDAALDALPIDLYNLEDYGEELSYLRRKVSRGTRSSWRRNRRSRKSG